MQPGPRRGRQPAERSTRSRGAEPKAAARPDPTQPRRIQTPNRRVSPTEAATQTAPLNATQSYQATARSMQAGSDPAGDDRVTISKITRPTARDVHGPRDDEADHEQRDERPRRHRQLRDQRDEERGLDSGTIRGPPSDSRWGWSTRITIVGPMHLPSATGQGASAKTISGSLGCDQARMWSTAGTGRTIPPKTMAALQSSNRRDPALAAAPQLI
jgi:hypothetical protein